FDPSEADFRARLDLGRLIMMAEDPAVEGRQGDIHAGRPQIRDEQMAGIRSECELTGWTTTGRRAWVALEHQGPLDELAHSLRDDRPPEPGPLDELRARPGPPEPDLVEDMDERIECFVGQRAGHDRDHRRSGVRRPLLHLTIRST